MTYYAIAVYNTDYIHAEGVIGLFRINFSLQPKPFYQKRKDLVVEESNNYKVHKVH